MGYVPIMTKGLTDVTTEQSFVHTCKACRRTTHRGENRLRSVGQLNSISLPSSAFHERMMITRIDGKGCVHGSGGRSTKLTLVHILPARGLAAAAAASWEEFRTCS